MGFPVRFEAIQQHGIAIAEEAVALSDRMGIGGLHEIEPDEGRHQHQQGGFRQMKVGDQLVNHLKAIARPVEWLATLPTGLHPPPATAVAPPVATAATVSIVIDSTMRGRTFQCAQAGCTHRDHPPSRRLGGLNGGHGRLGHMQPFAVHHVVLDALDPHRRKGARAHMPLAEGKLSPVPLTPTYAARPTPACPGRTDKGKAIIGTAEMIMDITPAGSRATEM